MIRPLSTFALVVFVATGAAAQSELRYGEGQRVDPAEVARILGKPAAPKTRAIRMLDQPGAAAEATPASLSLPVRFAFDSADIEPAARPQLDALAEGIKLLPRDVKVLVEGHTDAVGAEAYNLQLSQRRAQAVKQYLVGAHGIDGRRLVARGQGKQRPIEGSDPNAPENRRVQFRGQ